MGSRLLPRSTLTSYTKVSTGRWMAAAAVEWIAIVATIWAFIAVGNWLLLPVALVIIGSRQHALGALAHEGSHHLVSRHRRVNDLLSDVLAAYPNGFTTVGFRTTHLRHHAFLETAKDPSRITVELMPADWTFPMSKGHVAKMFAKDLTGLSQTASSELLKYLWEIPGGRTRHVAQLLAFHAVIVSVLFWAGYVWVYPLLWVVPLFTVAIAFYRIRAIAEHSGMSEHTIRYLDGAADPLSATRTTVHRDPVSRFFLSPHNISYHVEHHLYPSVPMFQLRRLHARLREVPEFAEQAHITRGHRALLRELTAPVDQTSTQRSFAIESQR